MIFISTDADLFLKKHKLSSTLYTQLKYQKEKDLLCEQFIRELLHLKTTPFDASLLELNKLLIELIVKARARNDISVDEFRSAKADIENYMKHAELLADEYKR